MTIREALGSSLNIPAVKVLTAVGPQQARRPHAARRRRSHGAARRTASRRSPSRSAASACGSQDLAHALCRPGARRRGRCPLTWHARRPQRCSTRLGGSAASRRLLSPVAAWYVTDILKDAPPPPNAKGGRIAYKTGTSYGYRDAWAAGYDGRHTIAVWVGRPDGAPTPGLTGRTAAAPILFDAFQRLGRARAPAAARPPARMRVTGASCRRR